MTPSRLALCASLVVSLAACDQGGSSPAPLDAQSAPRDGGACEEPDVEGVSVLLFASGGSCLSGRVMVLYRCSPIAVPVLRLASAKGPVAFLGGPFAVPASTLPANVRFAGSGDGVEVLIADPLSPSPEPTSSSPGPTAGTARPTVQPQPLVYVRRSGVTERWLRLERRPALHDPPVAWLIGDSILDGGREDVEAAFEGWDLTLDAAVGRPSSSGVTIVDEAAQEGADAVLVELGTNDTSVTAFREDLIRMLDSLRGVPLVIWQTTRGPEEDELLPQLNATIREVVPGYANAAIADWEAFVPDDAVQSDGIHPDPGHEGLEAELVGPLFSEWLEAESGEGATSCGPAVVRAAS